MKIAFYESHTEPAPTVVDASWDELVGLLTETTRTECTAGLWHVVRHPDRTDIFLPKDCPAKFCQAWSPVDIEGDRANTNVRAITCAVFDLDHLTLNVLRSVLEHVDGFEYLLHSTHTPQCYRLAMPLTRAVQVSEWPAFLRAVTRELDIPADPACKDLSRLFFLPTCPNGREPTIRRGAGASLDVDAVLALAGHVEPSKVAPLPSLDEESADLNTLRGILVNNRRRRAGSTRPEDRERYDIVGRILAGEALAAEGARDNTINQAASLLAFILPVNTCAAAVVELLRPSLAAMPCEPEGLPHWLERAEHSFTRASTRRHEQEAKRAIVNAQIKERLTRKPAPADAGASAASDDKWKTDLIARADGSPKACGENVVTILSRSPETRGTIRFNEVSKDIVVKGGPFDGIPSEVLAVAVTDWLQRAWGIGLGVSDVGQRLLRVAYMNSYDPLRDYLLGVSWDGVPRVDDFLLHYCDALRLNGQGDDITEHLRKVGRKWFISAVARALDPGCQVDTVLVMEGKQGRRKTSALRILGGEWFVETQLVLSDKDTQIMVASSWLVELSELASIRKTESNSLKAFLTRLRDKYRPPYGRVMTSAPRRCVFIGTTNDEDYLTDRTGNRRYWCVLCGPELYNRLEEIRRDRDQLWAEAVTLFYAGEPWWLNESEQKIADAQAEERLGESAIEARIAEWWYGLHPAKRAENVTTTDIAEMVLKFPFDRITRALQTEIGTALRRLGFDSKRLRQHGSSPRVYVPTEAMLEAPQGGRPTRRNLNVSAASLDRR